MAQVFTAHAVSKSGKVLFEAAEYPSRVEAVMAAFRGCPRSDRVSSGYGYGGSFAMEWNTRAEFMRQHEAA